MYVVTTLLKFKKFLKKSLEEMQENLLSVAFQAHVDIIKIKKH